MSNSRKYWLIPSALAGLGGVALWGLASYYFWRYFNEPANPSRNELGGGVFVGLASSLPFWVAAVGFAVPARELLPRWLLFTLAIPGVLVGVGYAALLIYVFARATFG